MWLVSFVLGNMACSQLQVMSDGYVLLALSGVLAVGSRMRRGGTCMAIPLLGVVILSSICLKSIISGSMMMFMSGNKNKALFKE